MKNLFLLVLTLIVSCTFAFAQSNDPYTKGKYFGNKLIEYSVTENNEAMDKLSDEIDVYAEAYLETEEDLDNLFKGIAAGIYEGCEKYGIPEEIADQIVVELATEFLKEFGTM